MRVILITTAYILGFGLALAGSSTLSTEPSWVIEGMISDGLGYEAGTAGDVNGDGFADLLVVSLSDDEVRVYHGSPTGPGLIPDWIGFGYGVYGRVARRAGDVNGDGYDDLMVSEPFWQGDLGRVLFHYGSPDGLSTTLDWQVWGFTSEHLTSSAASAGDVNGDGYGDVIIGSSLDRAMAFYGSPTGLDQNGARPSGSFSNADWTVTGPFNDGFGHVAGAGDVNGDGYSDVLVTAPFGNTNGQVWAYFGSSSGLSTTADWLIDGDPTDQRFGDTANTAGDVNGDGFSDVVIYNWGDGEAQVFHGGVAGLPPTPNWVGMVGRVAPAGDVNADGYSDLGGRDYFGVAPVVFHGSSLGLSAMPDWTTSACETSKIGGRSDYDGDGISDVTVGNSSWDSPDTNSGMQCVFNGGAGTAPTSIPQQRRADDSAPIASLGASDLASGFRVSLFWENASGPTRVKPEWEVKPLATLLDGSGLGSGTTWYDTDADGVAISELIDGLTSPGVYHWRVRVVVDPAIDPLASPGPWLTPAWNGLQEGDLRLLPCMDQDGDGHGPPGTVACLSPGVFDCNDANGAVFPGAAEINDGVDNQCPGDIGHGLQDEIGGIAGFHNPTDRNEYSWTMQDGATSYEVVRWVLPDDPSDCLTTATANTFWVDVAVPASGDVFGYLVRPAAPFPGSLGADSTGTPRTSVCP